jgi:mono/diheme cytochrome c family protein
MRAAGAAAAVIALAAAGAGCGVWNSPSAEERGRAVFVRACASCHTLGGRERGAEGGDLAIGRMRLADVVSFTRAMPVRPPLTARETEAVARYVYTAQRRARR